MSLYIYSRYTFLTRLCKYIHGILRGYLNVESRLVFNEYSLKLLMLELCARRENKPAKREGTINRGVKLQPVSWIYVCCVLTNSLERRNMSHLSGLASTSRVRIFFLFSQASPPTSTPWDEHTSIAQCSTKCCVKRPASAQIKRLFFFFWPRHDLSFSACRREKWH